MSQNVEGQEANESVKYLKAMLLLQLGNYYAEPDNKEKPEVLLSKSGFTQAEIAELLGKSRQAVSQAVDRAKK